MRLTFCRLPAAVFGLGCYCIPLAVSAVTVNVNSSVPISTEVVPQLSTVNTALASILTTEQEIATAIAENASKTNAIITQTAQANREQQIFSNQVQRLEEARRSFTLPESICSESASGVAVQARNEARATTSSLSSGSGISKAAVKERFTTPPASEATDAYTGAAVHASYCTEVDYSAFGGTTLCPSVGSYPGGDSQVRSLYDGAGKTGKTPDLTFSQDQIDAAQAYLKNTARPSAGRTLKKGDAVTTTGMAYTGLQNEFNAILDAAAEPQQSLIADSTPNSATTAAVNEAINGSDSAKSYYEATVSDTARTSGMSNREFEAFEVGRRYANTDYQTDLQQMDGDNLTREQIRISSLIAWELHDIKEQIRKNNILTGQLLAVTARDSYAARLGALEDKINNGVSR
ncbi:TPA: conjugal transfer protein TraW [Escherichia coli]|uniref:conjugal transfer protein TraW n=1 Tax=Escherichia coli TaxID=562 RepID=UPI0017CE8451|nr:conjugal transfer protein TraW [Escherichia coli]EEO1611052.1 conjugal transfer protein [Salmonella enterica subsp. enterica serovar Enteritidis]EFO9914313.1 conjugal transfer protein TraW [Salmonella enterica subsp. enterica serovar Typhimurium]EIS7040348.1 conjugal transfer protein TraW [Salmonella enterica subsp. enterica serovar Saintpaul]EEY1340386.1 conjugal transfer protein TraW [Escherichia coli]EFG6888909.1 conjugal transfer protein TraW [Escherichia coli]